MFRPVFFHTAPELGFSVDMEEELVPVKALDVGYTILESKKKLLGMALGTEKWP